MLLYTPSPYLQNAAGAALRYRENEKVSAYTPFGCRFLPIAFESYGTLGSFCGQFYARPCFLCRESFSSYSSATALSSLSILLQKIMPRCCVGVY